MPTDISRELSPPVRLALAYASRAARPAWTGLLVLDERLARFALTASEPLFGQMRLAWWRDRLREPAGQWPQGEPLLALLREWEPERPSLEALVDGWERMVGGPETPDDVEACVAARTAALAALARLVGCTGHADAVATLARSWASADLAARLGGDAAGAGPDRIRLPRPMRPLAILADLARRPASLGGGGGVRAMARIIRLGLLGR